MSTSIVLEAAELAEHTQWTPDAELDDVLARRKEHIEHEIADLVILLTYLATDLDTDIERAVGEKPQLNADKYPVDRARGSSRKYDEL